LFSCKKQQVIPDDYRFLIGSWKCTDCDDATNISITDESFSLKSVFFRSFNENIFFLKESQPYYRTDYYNMTGDKWKGITLNKNKHAIYFDVNIITQDTIMLFTNTDNMWTYAPTYYTFKKQ
jgi:hypothetical protein